MSDATESPQTPNNRQIMAMVDWVEMKSSNIAAAGYIAGQLVPGFSWFERKLFVRFVSGDVYVYHNVPREIWNAWLAAPSKGSYHYANIRKSFSYEKVT